MATFPVLKTGVVMQYPASSTIRYSNLRVQFVDGFEQRYRDYATPLHEWVIRLNLLDEPDRETVGIRGSLRGACQQIRFETLSDGIY